MAILEEYLVKLGVSTDDAGISKFFGSIRSMGSLAEATQGSFMGLMEAVVKVQVEVVSAFAAMGAAAVKLGDDVAMTDQQYRLFGLSMLMNLETAKKYKIALDALGDPALGLIRADPEMRRRFEALWEDQKRMQASLNGEDYETNMVKLRDFHFQLTRLEVEFKYLGMAVVNGLVKAFGPGLADGMDKLRKFNDWFTAHLPEIRDKVNQYLVPILKDVWSVLKDTGELLGDLASDFADVVNTIVGDSSGLDTATPKWEKFAKAVEHIVNVLDVMIKDLTWIEKHLPVGTLLGAWTGAKVGTLFGPEGTLPGALAGAVAGLGVDIYRGIHGAGAGQTATNGAMPQQASALAQQVSAKTGIAPDLLWSQWAHETGGFKHLAAANNLAGIRIPGTYQYMSFNSLDEFGSYYANMMRAGGRYSGIESSQTPAEFAAVLKHGGYYADTQRNYTAGMNAWDARYKGGGDVSISGTTINITQPGASAAEIASAVHRKLAADTARRIQGNLAEFQGGY